MGCMAAGLGVLFTEFALSPEPNFAFLVLALVVAGIGFGVAVVPITTVALSALPSKHSGMAASATTTTREVGTVLGVAVLGSLFNNRLLTFLTDRLASYGWPEGQQQTVIDGVLTGVVPPYLSDYQPVIDNPTMDTVTALWPDPAAPQREIAEGIVKATQAAFDAVGNGVSWSLWAAGGIIIASGIVAYFTFPRNA
jgi:MFS family permease